MDVLSDVIAVMRTGAPRSALVEWQAPWGQRFPAVPGSAGIQIVVRGGCWLVPADGEPFPLGTGDVVFCPRGERHGLAGARSTPLAEHACDPRRVPAFGRRQAGHANAGPPAAVTLCGAYQLDAARPHPLLAGLPPLLHLPGGLGHDPRLRAGVDLLVAELASPRPGTDALVPALLDTLLVYVLRAWLSDQPAVDRATGWAAALTDPAVGAALAAIHRDPARPWTVAGLAAHAGLSRAAFSRRFTLLVGRPPMAYLSWWRLTTARRLLRDSDAPLSVVARQVGYGSEFAFASAFKREFRIAPGHYRRRGRQLLTCGNGEARPGRAHAPPGRA
jgi:AraC-like DNA-binding protein